MVWKMLAVACIAVAFATTAQAECGDSHATTDSSEASTPDTTNKLAASTQAATDSSAVPASSGQAVRQ